jgi:hypothetical protein
VPSVAESNAAPLQRAAISPSDIALAASIIRAVTTCVVGVRAKKPGRIHEQIDFAVLASATMCSMATVGVQARRAKSDRHTIMVGGAAMYPTRDITDTPSTQRITRRSLAQ